jgi:hypothetical protein
MTKLRSMTGPEAKALVDAEKAKRSPVAIKAAPTISDADMEDFRLYQATKAERAARQAIGVDSFTLTEKACPQGAVGFAITGAMPDGPNDKGSFLNDNRKVIISGKAYTLQVGLYPYAGKLSVERLKSDGVVVGTL